MKPRSPSGLMLAIRVLGLAVPKSVAKRVLSGFMGLGFSWRFMGSYTSGC